jgi:hypothetical protein
VAVPDFPVVSRKGEQLLVLSQVRQFCETYRRQARERAREREKEDLVHVPVLEDAVLGDGEEVVRVRDELHARDRVLVREQRPPTVPEVESPHLCAADQP